MASSERGVACVPVPEDRHEFPLQCIFFGTVNPDTYVLDGTGNRRFWPLRCGTIEIPALTNNQLWAEAVHCFREGAILWIEASALPAGAWVSRWPTSVPGD